MLNNQFCYKPAKNRLFSNTLAKNSLSIGSNACNTEISTLEQGGQHAPEGLFDLWFRKRIENISFIMLPGTT
jgi:hypothetical protein